MTTIMLVVFLGVAALVVDLGGSYANRRKMPNSADSAAAGPAQELAGAGNSETPCNGSSTGNFGLLDFAFCSTNSSLGDNVAAGADHIYTTKPTGALADIPDNCAQPGPNTVDASQGNPVGPPTAALL